MKIIYAYKGLKQENSGTGDVVIFSQSKVLGFSEFVKSRIEMFSKLTPVDGSKRKPHPLGRLIF